MFCQKYRIVNLKKQSEEQKRNILLLETEIKQSNENARNQLETTEIIEVINKGNKKLEIKK